MWLVIIGVIVLAAGAWYLQRLSNDKMLMIPGNELVNPGRFFTLAVKKVANLKMQVGYEKLTKVQKTIYCIDQFYVQFNLYGSFSAVVVNLPDARFILDVPGCFRNIGAHQLAAIIQQMISVFGTECFMADVQVRKNQQNKLTNDKHMMLNNAEANFRNCSDNWLVLVAKYIEDRREDFDYNLG